MTDSIDTVQQLQEELSSLQAQRTAETQMNADMLV